MMRPDQSSVTNYDAFVLRRPSEDLTLHACFLTICFHSTKDKTYELKVIVEAKSHRSRVFDLARGCCKISMLKRTSATGEEVETCELAGGLVEKRYPG